MDPTSDLLHRVAQVAADYLDGLDERPVDATTSSDEVWSRLPAGLPAEGIGAEAVLDELLTAADGAIVATGSPRYFGYVVGEALPAAIAADWLTSVWDQNAGMQAIGPAAAALEDAAGRWVLELLGLPATASFAVTTGCQMAHVTALAAARHHVLAARGWDVEQAGLAGAPPIRLLVGEHGHVTVGRAARLLGFGLDSLVAVPVDGDHRMRPDALAERLGESDGPTIVVAQLGEVNMGAMDPVGAIVDTAREQGAWVHVDGAFGLWARASSSQRHLAEGAERADSWATDGHKWLNVPYDCGIAICAHPDDHTAAIGTTADYIAHGGGGRDQVDWTPEFSRRARGIALYAAIRHLGRDGVEELVDRGCALAGRFATKLAELDGAELLAPQTLNQLLVSFGSDERTAAVIARVQASGECWMSTTTWQGRLAVRVSVVGFRTQAADVDRSVAAFAAALAD